MAFCFKQASKQANKQANKQASKQANKQMNKDNYQKLLNELKLLKAREKMLKRHLEEALGHLDISQDSQMSLYNEAFKDLADCYVESIFNDEQLEINVDARNLVIEECASIIDASIFEPKSIGAETKRRCAERIRQLKTK